MADSLYDYWNKTTTPDQGGQMSGYKVNPDGTVTYSLGGQTFTKAPQDFNAQVKTLGTFMNQTAGTPTYSGTFLPTNVPGASFGGSNTAWSAPVAPKSFLEANPQGVAPAIPPSTGSSDALIKLQNAANLTGVQPAAMQTATGSAALTPPAVPNVKQPLVKSEPKRVAFAPGDTSSYPPPNWDPWREPRSGSQQAIDLWDNRYEQWRNQGGGGSPADTSVTHYVGSKASPEGYKYYGPTGKAYAGDETSYWLNAAENQWYMGNKETNKITAIPKPPFDPEAVPNPPPVDPTDPISNTDPMGENDLGLPVGWNVPPPWWTQAGRSAADWIATMRSAYGGGGGTTNTPSPSGTSNTGGYVPGKMIADYAASQQGTQAKSWLQPGEGYGEASMGHPTYFNEAGKPYHTGEDTKSFWYNQPERKWYTGNVDNKIAATTTLPWMNQQYGAQTGNNYSYMNAQGKPYGPGDTEAWWYNAAEKIWYHGSQDGKITKAPNPPWM